MDIEAPCLKICMFAIDIELQCDIAVIIMRQVFVQQYLQICRNYKFYYIFAIIMKLSSNPISTTPDSHE